MKYIGIDEAGRGPWAGPVIACCFTFLKSGRFKRIIELKRLLKDSKKLSHKKREEIFELILELKESGFVDFEYSFVSAKKIDKIGIKNANKLAMEKSLKKLIKLEFNSKINLKNIIIDGNDNYSFKFIKKINSKLKNILNKSSKQEFNSKNNSENKNTINIEFLIKGDDKIDEIKGASIVAKVMRDRLMIEYSKKYEKYGFEKHKGYGTKFHHEMLQKFGVCKLHRKSFKPIKNILY